TSNRRSVSLEEGRVVRTVSTANSWRENWASFETGSVCEIENQSQLALFYEWRMACQCSVAENCVSKPWPTARVISPTTVPFPSSRSELGALQPNTLTAGQGFTPSGPY